MRLSIFFSGFLSFHPVPRPGLKGEKIMQKQQTGFFVWELYDKIGRAETFSLPAPSET